MNVGHEEEELKPYTEPEPDFNDTKRIGKASSRMLHMAYTGNFILEVKLNSYTEFQIQAHEAHHTSNMFSFYLNEKLYYNAFLIAYPYSSLVTELT